ncbi:MAG: XRE family transcriptional regulator [Burkholderiales bacterium]|nr:XRE family transcriptional regulator [Burkholderiales bacterium]
MPIDEAAKVAGVPVDRIEAWERGDEKPPLGKLQALAAKYKRPLAVMFLPEPPRDFQALRDFRRVDPAEAAMPPRVALEIRVAQERRELLLDMVQETGEEPPAFVLTAEVGEDVEAVADRVRSYFGIAPGDQARWARRKQVFDGWRARIEAKGVLVFVMGGPHAPAVREVRGFAIPARHFPVAAVNGKDKTNGRTFSLLHEVVHLALGQAVVENAISTYRRLPAAERAVERFCNAVAAAVLMPKAAMAEIAVRFGKGPDAEWTDPEINDAADWLGASREAVVLRAVALGFAGWRFYAAKRPRFEEEYAKLDEPSGKSVPVPSYMTMVNRYGRPFARAVFAAYRDRRITMNDAAAFLEVQAKRIDYVARQAMAGA